MSQRFLTTTLAAITLVVAGLPLAAQTAADGSLPLSDILRIVEADGVRTVYSAEAHRRSWEVVSCEGRSRICREDVLDPNTGALRNSSTEAVWTLPPEGALPASEIAAMVEGMNIGAITEMDFDDREWDVEIRASIGSRAELKINPMTGVARRCEGRACP
jgi:hypothetical protein